MAHGINAWDRREVPLDDHAMERHARELAVSLGWDSTARLLVGDCSAGSMRRLTTAANELSSGADALTAAMEWLTANGRLMESFAAPLNSLPVRRLPASGGTARVQILMREIALHGDAYVSRERLIGCIRAFDEVRALTMDELWSVPAALRAALIEAYCAVARRTIEAQRQRAQAEKWVLSGARPDALGARPAQTYLERALQLMHEQDMPDARMELERQLSLRDMDAQTLIRTEHERQAIDKLWLDNLVSTLHMLGALRWDECFMLLSRTELELRRDPAGTYPMMDDESRARIRGQVTRLSRRTGMGENTIARHAIAAAEEGEGIRREVCWWLYDDEGIDALSKRLGTGHAARELTPDPIGRAYIASVALLAAAALMLYLTSRPGWAMAVIALPILWGVGAALSNAAASQVKPCALLKMKYTSVPDELRALVVMPALLSSPGRSSELCAQLQALGCLETDKNIEFLLLGDLPDADRRVMPDDEAIASAAQAAVSRANERAGRPKYHFLWRERDWCEGEGRYMAPERKRGALTALNALLLGGECEFADAEAAGALADRFSLVITLDAGTRMIPGTAHKLIGAIAHPLNRSRVERGRRRGYAVLQPRMELPADAVANRFVLLFGGEGGVDTYPTSVSDVYQDLCGQGIFGGKGVYDLRAFHEALKGKLPSGAVLSHDLIEGLIAGAGFINDVTLYDGHPRTAKAYLTRLHRWTRGDWQLLPCLMDAWKVPLRALDRYKLADNLRRSVVPICQLLLMLIGFLAHSAPAVVLSLAPWWLPMLLYIRRLRPADIVRFFLRLALLPAEAVALADAIGRTLWRVLVTHKHLLQWVTADDADRQRGDMAYWPGWVAAALLLPAMRSPGWAALSVALAALWCLAPMWAKRMERPIDRTGELSEEERAVQLHLAERTWRFFDRNVPDNGLPPDNLQLDPPTGAARRTSPTNVGLYLLSCLAAQELDLIRDDEMLARMAASVTSLEKMEKWRGHLYNWYDIDLMEPLSPRYVSSVDGGNLAACLLTCASALEETDRALAGRMEALAGQMDFTALYDESRKLFSIGMDVSNNRLSASHYDLMASESRILSYTAMMLRQVPVEHWAHLGRAMAPVNGAQALISWSGTMFEYLMPELFMPSIKGTLFRQSRDAVVRAQILSRISVDNEPMPWGVSESGYYAFDLRLNYQYRAFGLPSLSLRGDAADRVIAPYASMLALAAAPHEVTENLNRMRTLGLVSEQGLYEAVDCAPERLPEGAQSRIIFSHMAHHQGMILAAQANALCGQAIARRFMDRPEALALKLLLQEKPATRLRLSSRSAAAVAPGRSAPPARLGRLARPDLPIPDCHLMFGADAGLLVTATGEGFLRRWGVLANRRSFKPEMNPQGFFTHLDNHTDGRGFLLSGQRDCPKWLTQRAHFDAGTAEWAFKADGLEAKLAVCLSPEDGALCRRVSFFNMTNAPIELTISDCFEVALCNEADYAAHPAFQNLFVESACAALNALCFTRRPRNPGERCPTLLHVVAGGEGAARYETDLTRLIGRTGSLGRVGGIARDFSQTTGQVLNPCSALRVDVKVPPMGRAFVAFAVGLVEPDDAQAFVDRHLSLDTSLRALELAGTQARAMLKFLNLPPRLHHALQRSAALMAYPALRPRPAPPTPPEHGFERRELWAMGISGEYPILLGIATDKEGLPVMRELMRAHEFYRAMGLWCDLVLVNDYGNDYEQPVRDGLNAMVASSHLLGLNGQPGGVHMLEGATLNDGQRALLKTTAALFAEGGRGLLVDQIKQQLPSDEPRVTPAAHMPPGRRLARLRHGFTPDGYRIECSGTVTTPAPWVNVMSNPSFGAMVSERGGGFIWYLNSRNGRITPFDNDALRESFGDLTYLHDRVSGAYTPLSPVPDGGESAHIVSHGQGYTTFSGQSGGLSWTATHFVDPEWPVKCQLVEVTNKGAQNRKLTATAYIDFLMGVSREDARLLRAGEAGGMLWAVGTAGGLGFAAFVGQAGSASTGRLPLTGERVSALSVDLDISPNHAYRFALAIGYAPNLTAARALLDKIKQVGPDERLKAAVAAWDERLEHIAIETPDADLNRMVNRWLPYQTLSARIWGRAGYYQAGGAYGFRDQLQDMLALIPYEPELVRAHLLLCAAHQFEDGDVQHWWHPERTGVRTRISDDLLFLPYVTAAYTFETGDTTVLEETAPYLKNVTIPEGHEDWYGEAQPSDEVGTLREHCLRAIRRAARVGRHGLILMGTGDWNDGMNRIGHQGMGESVWLTEFAMRAVSDFALLCDAAEREELTELVARLRGAVEKHGWDGAWYLRAYADDGTPIGGSHTPEGEGCRIDAIAQCWAVMADLDPERARAAMAQVSEQLIDREHGIIKLLTPPFDGTGRDPGYIRGYPPGVRENGGQYTHAACWVVMALAELNLGDEAWAAFEMLMPYAHADTREKVEVYRVEPYVIAADVYSEPPHTGRGGWTWYTGSAGWMVRVAHAHLMGYVRRGEFATLDALLKSGWDEASLTVRVGGARYRLTARRGVKVPELDGRPLDERGVHLVDDGQLHQALFPPRPEARAPAPPDPAREYAGAMP